MAELTHRQREALQHAAHGASVLETAVEMDVTEGHVQELLNESYIRLDVHSKAAAVTEAIRLGIIHR